MVNHGSPKVMEVRYSASSYPRRGSLCKLLGFLSIVSVYSLSDLMYDGTYPWEAIETERQRREDCCDNLKSLTNILEETTQLKAAF